MRRRLSSWMGLLVCAVASSALAQAPEGERLEFQPLPFAADPPPAEVALAAPLVPLPVVPPQDASGEATTTDEPLEIGPVIELGKTNPLEKFRGYRYKTDSTEWILGDDNQFGMFSLNFDHYQAPGVEHGLGFGLQFHFPDGPVRTDMPARLYDFSVAYQVRDQLGMFSYDVAVSVMASSDFEGSSREGIRFPGHAVGFLTVRQNLDLVFGVDYLDRGDVKLLPVAGLIAVPSPNLRLEMVFPRPRVVVQLDDQYQLYVGGELGGGTWAIERATMVDDLATYRDLRVCIGLTHLDADSKDRSSIEIGYLFDRHLEYASGQGDYSPADTAMIRLISSY